MKTLGLFLLPTLASGAPLSIAAPPDAALTTPHRIEVLAEGLKVPWELRFLPDGRQIFTERIGRVRIVEQGKLLEEPALTLPAAQGNKMGLLGLALAPDFEKTGHLFLAWDRALGDRRFELRMVRSYPYSIEDGQTLSGTYVARGEDIAFASEEFVSYTEETVKQETRESRRMEFSGRFGEPREPAGPRPLVIVLRLLGVWTLELQLWPEPT